MSNSLEQLLLRMKDTPSTVGWGAILVVGQSQVNALFTQQYADAFSELQFLPPLTDELYLDSGQTIKAQLKGVVLGPLEVLFDFEHSSLQSSVLTIRLNIVGGTYTTSRRDVGSSETTVIASQRMTAGMGFYVQASLSLSQAFGQVDNYGIAKLDFKVDDDTRFYSNLERSEVFQEALGGVFKAFLQAQKDFRFSYELGHMAFRRNHVLSPVEFFIRTQINPSPNPEGTSEGAVVFFIRLKGTKGTPGLPTDGSGFPYFIPDDKNDKKDLYSVALVLNHQLLGFADEMQLGLLKNIGLGRKHEFVEVPGPRREPCDLLLLGNTKLTAENLTIEPQFLQLKGGDSQQFVVRDAAGKEVTAVNWSVSSVSSPLAVGEISDTGHYTAFRSTLMDQDLLPTAVTATSKKAINGFTRKTTAMVLSNFEGVSVAPFVRTITLGDQPFDLVATSAKGAKLTWTLLDYAPGQPGLGKLDVTSENRASYTPPAPMAGVPLVRLQRIRVEDTLGNVAHTSVALLSGRLEFELTPSYTEHISKLTGTVQLKMVDQNLYHQAELVWGVLGQGTIADGLYEAPATLDEGIAVNIITCDLKVNDGLAFSSFAIAQPLLRHIDPPPPTWIGLDTFKVEAIEPSPTCYANGYQQIPVRITIGTASIEIEDDEGNKETVFIPVSDKELATLVIYDESNNSDLDFIEEYQEGIPDENDDKWAVNLQRNRFDLMNTASFEPASTLIGEGERIKDVYIHCNSQGTRTLAARFKKDNGQSFRSEDHGTGNTTVRLTAVNVPTPALTDYGFVGKRVFNGEGAEGYSDEDEFSYVLDSIDYWALGYKRLGLYPKRFVSVEFEDNVSLIRWESEQRDEVFLSYTGYVFYPAPYYDINDKPTMIVYDSALSAFALRRQSKLNTMLSEADAPVSPGQLVITLNREANIPYFTSIPGVANGDALDNETREHLSKVLKVLLFDVEGNRHRLQISFESTTLPDSRNKLLLGFIKG
ncbi:hypothetical protein [Pseudomonas sp. CCC3.1]|uniref:hypothetical protein n=1 Tax=Pseudomonas sp. CCC3.1 TaxID=3048607 RepID=UPI002AC9F15C|nr:hypothetical protein [Pseudomonas sp. CCC3.1]MEB0207280.1 hypothetical protein [Pseudomonas sp. CCC3.1]WPX37664.1 hypothetical protein RHM56_05625 [Pseudomonas sp. CCC3.1]